RTRRCLRPGYCRRPARGPSAPVRSGLSYPAAVHDEILSGAHAAVVSGEEQGGTRQILGHQEAGHALRACNLLAAGIVQPQARLLVGDHPAWHQAVDADVLLAEL